MRAWVYIISLLFLWCVFIFYNENLGKKNKALIKKRTEHFRVLDVKQNQARGVHTTNLLAHVVN
jgi:hypothetical protein